MESLNAIVTEQTTNVLQMIGISLKESNVNVNDNETIGIKIEFIGDIKGTIELYFTKEIAMKIANTMLCGMATVKDIDDMAKSTLGEAANMISGAVSTALANQNISTDIKAPIVTLKERPQTDDCISLKYENDKQVINANFKIST